MDNVVKELDKQSQKEKLPPQPEPSWNPACPNCWGFQPIPSLLECSNHSQDLDGAGHGSAALWEVSNPKKLRFTLFPTHSVAKSLHYLCLAGPRRGWGQQGGDMGSWSLCKGSPQPSGPVCWRYSQSPSTAWSDCKTLSKHVSGDVSLLVLWFPYLGDGDGAYLHLWSVWDSGRFSHVWE